MTWQSMGYAGLVVGYDIGTIEDHEIVNVHCMPLRLAYKPSHAFVPERLVYIP